MAGYSRDLRKVGFHSTENSALITVAALFNAGLFGRGAILVGTHAFGAILNELGVADARIAMTEDVDVARAGPIQIAALPVGGFLKLLTNTGLPFSEVPKLKLEVAVSSGMAEAVVEAISKAAGSGKIGDGKIFVSGLSDVVRIRTGERDEKALD